MQRDLRSLADRTFDLLVIGGGIHGAIAAWDAAQRGLSVALIDRHDFGGATSANSLKTVHGGLRYLQQADLGRMRMSIAERSALLRIAPHLVRPLAFLVPTSGFGKRSRAALGLALKLADAVGFDRNQGLSGDRTIPAGRVVSRKHCLELFSGYERSRLTGGAIWHDAQLRNSERLTLSFLLSAAEKGAVSANYVRADRLSIEDRTVRGASVTDLLGTGSFDVRARVVLNAAGPWVSRVLEATRSPSLSPPLKSLALAINLVSRQRFAELAIGFPSTWPASRDPVCGGNRYLFLSPWRQSTLIGTSYRLCDGTPNVPMVTEPELRELLDECNDACPALELSFDDVTFLHQGLVPLKAGLEPGRSQALAERSRTVDHEAADRVRGLVSILGLKYTTARHVAEKSIDLVFRKLGKQPVPCRTATTPIYGGDDAEEPEPAARQLVENHGDRAGGLARRFAERPGWSEALCPGAGVLAGEVLHAVESEMAVKLTDVVLRRTAMGSERCPPAEHIEAAARLMAAPLGWSDRRRKNEKDEVLEHYRPLGGLPHG